MLGDKIGEMTGKVMTQRILRGGDYRYLQMEVTIQENGTLCGMQGGNMATYTVLERIPGQLYGEGQGLVFTNDGTSAIWNGHGVGKQTGMGLAMSFRFSVAYQADGASKLGPLNSVLVIGEHEVDDAGNTKTTYWEWK